MRDSRVHRSAAIAIAMGSALLTSCSVAPQPEGLRPEHGLQQHAGPEAQEQTRQLEEARDINADARRNAQVLQAQIADLQADLTHRGIVLTLGDELFGGNTAKLNTDGGRRLDKVVTFLNRCPQRKALIEGYDGSMGTAQHDRAVPAHRAEAVKTYLVRRGIKAKRLTVNGNDAGSPVGDNGSAADRQTRHVEVVIEDCIEPIGMTRTTRSLPGQGR